MGFSSADSPLCGDLPQREADAPAFQFMAARSQMPVPASYHVASAAQTAVAASAHPIPIVFFIILLSLLSFGHTPIE